MTDFRFTARLLYWTLCLGFVRNSSKAVEINNLDFLFITQNQIKALEAAKNTTYCFNGKA